MIDRAEVHRTPGDYDAWELQAIAAALIGAESSDVCQVVMVIVKHRPEGGHEFAAATTIPDDAKANATILRHAADHLQGGCDPCRRASERRNRRGH